VRAAWDASLLGELIHERSVGFRRDVLGELFGP